MLWPVVLPAEITFWLLAIIVVLLTALAPRWKWKRGPTLAVSMLLSMPLFIPACIVVMAVVDSQRFGIFRYGNASEIDDFRILRYLPPAATNITLEKREGGHRARYSISEKDLQSFLDEVWRMYGKDSTIPREKADEDSPPLSRQADRSRREAIQDEFTSRFEGLGWQVPEELKVIRAPVFNNGAGATYFYDASTGTAYHRGSYW